VWAYEYDESGDLASVTDPLGAATRFQHAASGGSVVVSDAAGGHTLIDRDAAGRPVAVTNPLGATTRFSYDALGRVVAVQQADGTVVTTGWSIDGKPLHRTYPDGASETWQWDGENNLLAHTDPLGRTTRFDYAGFANATTRTDPDGTVTHYTWDTEIRLTGVTNPQALTWAYTYDPTGRIIAQTDFDGVTTEYHHDRAGQLRRISRGGVETAFEYDNLGNMVTEQSSEGETSYTWDPMGRVVSARGESEIVFERDKLGRITAETVNGRTVASIYDQAGRRTRRTTPSGTFTDYNWDTADQLTSIVAAGRRITFEHDSLGRETARAYGTGFELEQTWTARNRIASQTLATGRNPFALNPRLALEPTQPEHVLLDRTYAYGPDAALTELTDTARGTRHYTLDAAGRVTTVTASDRSEIYTYDNAGNLTSARDSSEILTGTIEYHGTRPIRTGRATWRHDRHGRPTRRTVTRLSRKPDTWHYEWDSRNQLTAVTTPDGTRWTYTYDPFGRRTRKTGHNRAGDIVDDIVFTWDGDELAEQVTRNGDTTTWTYRTGTFTPLAQHHHRSDRAEVPHPLMTDRQHVDQRFYAIVTDLLGTPMELVDLDNKQIAGHAATTLWGHTTWTGADTPLRFPGQYHDPETGFHYNRHRYYHPDTGRYLITDPLGLTAAPNPAAYIGNPTEGTDPLGLAPDEVCSKDTDLPSRNEAFRNAKRDSGIPVTQQPDSVNRIPLTDQWGKKILGDDGMPINTREYTFDRPGDSNIVIQDHGSGHYYGPNDPGNQGPHFNVRPDWNTRTGKVPGTQEHYPFGK
jgi:RHS repeat-associated protein